MARSNKQTLWVPILLIALGAGWLFSALDLFPEIDWIWTLGLAAIGVATFLVGGLDKMTVVIGPFFLLAALLSVLRQTGILELDIEIPILLIFTGCLMLIARTSAIPAPGWKQNKENDS